MAGLQSDLCVACLKSDRKMVSVVDSDKKLCFNQLLQPCSTDYDYHSILQICWECDARLANIRKFKMQVQRCQTHLQTWLRHKNKTNHMIVQDLQFNLKTSSQPSLSLLPDLDTTEDVKFEVLTADVKEESSMTFDNECVANGSSSDSDGDQFLIEFSRKKEKVVQKKKRKKRAKTETSPEPDIYKIVELTDEEVAIERKEMAAQEQYLNAMFKCERCVLTFPNSDDLRDHSETKHNSESSRHLCPVCECTFASEVSRAYHRRRHARRYRCARCARLFTSRRAVTKHYEHTHTFGISQYVNGKNGISLKNETESQENRNGEIPSSTEASFPCEFCDKKFRWKTSLRKHTETHRIEAGQKRKPYCEPCRLSFTTTANLQKHVRTSSKHQIQLKIRKMQESSDAATEAEIRESVNASRAQFACELCGARFQWRGNLRRHRRSHAARANGELVCQPCNRTFSSIATYKQHMKISKRHVTENEFKYMCSECGKRFANKTRLKDHVDWEHLKRYAHVCTRCDKVFKSSASLYLHVQAAHRQAGTGRLCHHCGKALPNLAKLRSHISAVHCGGAALACADCGARFAWSSCLARHARRQHSK